MEKVKQAIKQNSWPATVIVAVSGGVDSVVLLHALAQMPIRIVVAHVNYHLRPESDADASFVAKLAQKMNVIFEQRDWQTIPNHAVEKEARIFRYGFFNALAKQYQTDTIVVAHHANDQAETVLLKMIRGGQLRQMAGMMTKTNRIIRPFLTLTKQELIAYAHRNQLKWREDSTNSDPNYTPRNLLRNDVLPKITTINAQAVRHINDMAQQIQNQERLIDEQAAIYAQNIASWHTIPQAWQAPTLKYWLQAQQIFNIKESQIMQALQLLNNDSKPNGRITLNQGVQLVKSYNQLGLQKEQNRDQVLSPVMLKLNQRYFLANKSWLWTDHEPILDDSAVAFSISSEKAVLCLRLANASDKIALINGHKKLRRLAIDEKLRLQEREAMLVLTTADDRIVAVQVRNDEWRVSAEYTVKQNTQPNWLVWRIEET